jgi:ABC-2 type transport system permease protein
MTNWIGLYTLISREVQRTFRVAIQTLVTPWITALLYIFIFGKVIGSRIDLIAGVPYIQFVLPGILMMNVLMSSFMHASNAVYFKRFLKDIEEILVAPLSYAEMIIGFVSAAVIRAIVIAVGIYIIAILFGGATITHFFLFIFYVIAVSIIFALLGIIVGLWANGFEQLNIWNTFVITPLSFLGGVFYSIEMLPENGQLVAIYNPFFYFIDGIRYAMIGVQESNMAAGIILIFGLIASLGILVWYLFKIGWRLRE